MAANFGKIQAWGWSDGDDQWGSDVNNNFASVDRRLDNPVKGIVSDPSTITGQVNNDRYIVGVTPGGDFAGETNRIAYWSSVAYGGSDTWKFYSAPVGLTVSLAGGANYTLIQAGSDTTWIRTSTAYVKTWGEFKIAMQSSSFYTVFIDEDIFAPVDDLITVAGYKRVEGKAVSIENTTLTLNSGSVDFHGEFHIGNNAGSAGLLTGNSAIIRFRRVVVHTQSEYTGTGVASYEHVSGTFTGAVQQFWDNTNETADVNVDLLVGQGIVKGGSDEVKLGPHYLSMASSGVYSGGLLTVSGPVDSNVNIAATEGFVIDTSVFGIDTIVTTPVSVTSPIVFTPTNIATQNVTYVGLNSSGTQVEWNTLPTPEQRRDNIFLGVAVHSNRTTVEFVNNLQDVSSDITGQLHDLSRYLGYFNIEGNGVTANGANLNFNKAIGTAFKTGVNFEINPKDPDTNYLPAKVASSFRYRTQTGGEGSAITVIDPTSYDIGGTITPITGSNNQSTIQKIYVFASNEIRIQYGQTLYSSFSDAISAVGKEPFVTESNIHENGLLLCSLVVKKGATDLSDTADALFFQAGRFGETGSVGSTAVGTLQSGYDNSINPEILTNSTLGAVTLKRGSASDADNVLEVTNGSDVAKFEVTGEGDVSNSGQILQGNVANDTQGIIAESLKVEGTATFGGTVKSPTYNVLGGTYTHFIQVTGGTGEHLEIASGKDLVFWSNRADDANRKSFIFKNSGDIVTEGGATFTGRILQGGVNDDNTTGIIADSIKSEGGVRAKTLELGSKTDSNNIGSAIVQAVDTERASLELYGNSQGAGVVYVGQTNLYGGGIEYNGSGSTSRTGAGDDYVNLFRRDNGTEEWTARNKFDSNDWEFRGNVEAESFSLSALNTAPSSATDTGTTGEIRYTSDYIYICVATNTWKRSALTTW